MKEDHSIIFCSNRKNKNHAVVLRRDSTDYGFVVEGIHSYIKNDTIYLGVNKNIYREKYSHVLKEWFNRLIR